MKVAFFGSFAARLVAPVKALLGADHELIVADGARALADADVLVSLEFTADMANAAPRLRLLQVQGARLDRVDRAALSPRTMLANAYGHEAGIAEYVIGALLSMTRCFAALDAALRQGAWKSQWAAAGSVPEPWQELRGRHLGILGYGRIGEAVARRARAFEMPVSAVRRHPAHAAAADGVSVHGLDHFDTLLEESDVLVVTVPLSAQTRGMLGTRELALLKSQAVLVNVARAEVIDEAALFDTLAKRRIAGAVLDVWYRYPSGELPTLPSRLPFHELDNALMTPHVSGWTAGMLRERCEVIAENVQRLGEGQPLLNCVECGA